MTTAPRCPLPTPPQPLAQRGAHAPPPAAFFYSRFLTKTNRGDKMHFCGYAPIALLDLEMIPCPLLSALRSLFPAPTKVLPWRPTVEPGGPTTVSIGTETRWGAHGKRREAGFAGAGPSRAAEPHPAPFLFLVPAPTGCMCVNFLYGTMEKKKKTRKRE